MHRPWSNPAVLTEAFGRKRKSQWSAPSMIVCRRVSSMSPLKPAIRGFDHPTSINMRKALR